MSSENEMTTVYLIVRNETFELPSSLFQQLVEYSSSSDSPIALSDKEDPVYFNIDPDVFNAYVLYIQSGCFIRPDSISQEDLISELRRCGAPMALVNHYECWDFISVFSSHPYSSHPIDQKNRGRYRWLNVLILLELFVATCVLTIDLYRQILILNNNSYQETTPLFITIVYVIDGILFFYSCGHGVSQFISSTHEEKRLGKNQHLLLDSISCLGILSYFIIQRPITSIYSTPWNFLWIIVHLCRSFRLTQIGYRLINIQWCLYAISNCLWTFLQTITALFWIFIFSGSILYMTDIVEHNEQYSSMRLTILSAHETLYTIGYRNNAPYGYLTRLWTIISIYFMSSLVQILLWWFQTRVTIEWKKLLENKSNKID